MRDTKKDVTPKKQIIVVGVLGALLSLVGMIPGLTLFMIVLPIPYIHLIKKYGHSVGRQAIILTALLNGVVMGFTGVVLTLITFGLMAVFLGGAFYEEYAPKRTARISVAAAVISSLLLYFFGSRIGVIGDLKVALRDNPIWSTPWGNGITPEMRKDVVEYMLAILPGIFVSISFVLGLVTYHLSAYYLRWRGYTIQRLKPFNKWRFPRWVGLVYLVLWFVLQFTPPDVVTVNLMVIFMALLTGEGAALFLYYTERWGVYSWIRYVLVMVAIPFLGVLFLIGGLIDNVFQLRGFRKKA